jgi:hypothetical protein
MCETKPDFPVVFIFLNLICSALLRTVCGYQFSSGSELKGAISAWFEEQDMKIFQEFLLSWYNG